MIQKKCIFAAIFSYNGGGWPTAHCAPNPLQKGLKARPMSAQGECSEPWDSDAPGVPNAANVQADGRPASPRPATKTNR